MHRHEAVLHDIFRGGDVSHQQYRQADQCPVMQRIQLGDRPVRVSPLACRAGRREYGGHDGIACTGGSVTLAVGAVRVRVYFMTAYFWARASRGNGQSSLAFLSVA